jgi:hypothetical protein
VKFSTIFLCLRVYGSYFEKVIEKKPNLNHFYWVEKRSSCLLFNRWI